MKTIENEIADAGSTVRTVYESQDEILKGIKELHCPEGFECDLTFGNGSFWKKIDRPLICYDISPQKKGVVEADSRMLPLKAETLRNVVYDPPFLTYIKRGRKHGEGKVAMAARFGGYYTYDELLEDYRDTISEAYRVLVPGGHLVMKCQDIVHNHRLECTHYRSIMMAEIEGFRLKDLFVLPAKHRMPSPQKGIQRHARIWHCYFLVFCKPGRIAK
jgi:hypothetical protein